MAGPLNGLGAQTIPLANTFQPGKDAETNRKVSEERTQQAKGATGDYPSVESRKEEFLRARQVSDSSSDREQSNRRGSLIDITV
jgi:hypothetical protein